MCENPVGREQPKPPKENQLVGSHKFDAAWWRAMFALPTARRACYQSGQYLTPRVSTGLHDSMEGLTVSRKYLMFTFLLLVFSRSRDCLFCHREKKPFQHSGCIYNLYVS